MENIEVNVNIDCLQCVKDIFDNISNTPGRVDKENILKE